MSILQVIRCVTPPPEVLLPRIPSPITTFLPTGGPVRFLPPLTSASFFRLSLIVLAGPLYWRAKCDESFASGDFVLFADAMWHDLVDCIKIKSGVSTTQSMSHDGIADLVNALFPLQMEKFKIVQR
jgi:hypothetical protein